MSADKTTSEQTRRGTHPSPGWLSLMAEVYTVRRGLYFSRRRRFDDALRPLSEGGEIIGYPDAIYYITQIDLNRAKEAIGEKVDV